MSAETKDFLKQQEIPESLSGALNEIIDTATNLLQEQMEARTQMKEEVTRLNQAKSEGGWLREMFDSLTFH